MPGRVALALLVLVSLGTGALLGLSTGDDYPDPPASWATFRAEGIELRHPPGWRAERPAAQRGGTRVLARLAPAGPNPDRPGPLAELRVLRGPGAAARARRASEALVSGGVGAEPRLELEVPGAERTETWDAESGGPEGDRRRYRTAAVYANRGGELVALAVRAPIGPEPDPARTLAGSLRLEDR